MSTAREAILGRLKAATRSDKELPAIPLDSDVFADLQTEHGDDLVALFAERLRSLHGEVYPVPDQSAAREKILELAGESSVMAQANPWLEQLLAGCDLPNLTWQPTADLTSVDMARIEVGITTADCLVARTGSIVGRATTCGGRRLSVLPPLHIVVAKRRQLVPSLDIAFERVQIEDDRWSSAAIITGPSRTADIEKILVLGAHGPKRLAVIIIDSPTET